MSRYSPHYQHSLLPDNCFQFLVYFINELIIKMENCLFLTGLSFYNEDRNDDAMSFERNEMSASVCRV